MESSRFKYVMMAAVLASSLMLPVRQGATTPPDPFSVLRVYPPESVLETVLDVLFMLIFWAEIFLKCVCTHSPARCICVNANRDTKVWHGATEKGA